MTEIDVALKFMTQRDTFLREVKKRRNTDSDHVVPIKLTYSSTRIDDFDCIKEDLRTELAPYPSILVNGEIPKYVIVMDCGAGYDLHDFISHQNVAGKDVATVTSIAKEIALCLKFLNETCGIIHGDVKARNFVGRGVGNVGQFAAIDLDNASSIRTEEAGRKRTSSGYMPPEQATVEMYARSADTNTSSRRPPSVIATPAYDMWCFGVLLYFLCTGKQLFNVDTKEDVDDDDLQRICTWDDYWKEEKLTKVGPAWTEWIRLLDSLLQKDPTRRPKTWKEVIDEINTFGGQGKKKVYDRLVVFQAGPLVYKNNRTSEYGHCPQLDFQRESAMLREALKDAEQLGRTIDLVLEAATLDRLRALMATKWGRVVHFSGHCNERYMAWENDRGLIERVDSEALKGLFSGGQRDPMVVFISACHSEWVGRQLVDQNVRHVVCCDVDERLLDTAAHEFTRSFYRALACGGTLLEAFETAREAVRNSSDVQNSEVEAGKFLLLPEKSTSEDYVEYHSIQVFFTEEVPRILRDTVAEPDVAGLPKLKDVVWKRNSEQYSILENFMQYNADVVRVHGSDSCGKTSVVAALCERMLLRSRVHPLDYLLWYPSRSKSSTAVCLLYQQMEDIIKLMLTGDPRGRDQLEALWRDVGKTLAEKRLVLVLDTRWDRGWNENAERSETVVDCLHRFVQDILQLYAIASCKVVLIERSDGAIPRRSPWMDSIRHASVPVCPLEYDEAAELFALSVQTLNRHRFPILGRPDDLVELFYSDDDEISDDLYERFLGNGHPGKCRMIAQQLGEAEINQLLTWWNEAPGENNAGGSNGNDDEADGQPKAVEDGGLHSVHAEMKPMLLPLARGATRPGPETATRVELSVDNWDDLIIYDES
jgi:serine/threonine protein kinase